MRATDAPGREAQVISDRHVALIVEDDPMIATILKELVTSLGHSWLHAATLAEARALVAAGGYCYVLLDMQITADASAEASVGCGETVLRLARRKAPSRNADDKHVLPILVVTGYSRDPDFVSKVHKNGGDDFIPKPFGARTDLVLDKIRDALKLAEREEHDECEAAAGSDVSTLAEPAGITRKSAPATAPPLAPGETVRLAIEGTCRDQRNDLLVNGVLCSLPDATFLVLLGAVGVHLKTPGEWESAAKLGMTRIPWVPSRIVRDLRNVLPPGFRVLEANKPQSFRLNPAIVVERVDWAALRKHPQGAVRKIAGEFGRG